MIEKLFNPQRQETEEHWVSISDVMAGLMVIFLFIAISYMVNANRETDRYKSEAEQHKKLQKQVANLIDVYRNSRRAISEAIEDEFRDEFRDDTLEDILEDMSKWAGSLEENLSIRFKNPFEQGEHNVPPEFKKVLLDFFPRYIAILIEYKDDIEEIRIEGHTSSEWRQQDGEDPAYYNNMELSQDRARKVLEYVLEIRDSEITENKEWIKKHLTANGLSSSKPIPGPGESENKEESRRVEFRVVTKSESLIEKIKKIMEEFDLKEVDGGI